MAMAQFTKNLRSSSSTVRLKHFSFVHQRGFSTGDDDEGDGATTDFASALDTFWSPAVQQQLQAVAAGLPAVEQNLSSLSPGGPEYVKQMRRVETLATLERMLQQLVSLQTETLEMEALAQEASASGDVTMSEEAQSMGKKLLQDSKAIKLELLKFLVPHDDADSMDAILELRAGVGGSEASLWCSEMCSMYQRYCEQKGWDFEVASSASTESGGMREVHLPLRLPISLHDVTLDAGCVHCERQRCVWYAAV
jgi:protein subunit release factor A